MEDHALRMKALEIALDSNRKETVTTEEVVKAAQAYYEFLTKKPDTTP